MATCCGIVLAVAWLTALPMIRTGSLLYAAFKVSWSCPLRGQPGTSERLTLGAAYCSSSASRPPSVRVVAAASRFSSYLRWQVDPVLLIYPASAITQPVMPQLYAELVDLRSVRTEVVAARHRMSAPRIPLSAGAGVFRIRCWPIAPFVARR